MKNQFKAPEGWVSELKGHDLHLKHAECELIARNYVKESQGKSEYGISGTTKFLYKGKEYTFDRRGIEDSFYLGDKYSTYKTLDEAMVGELERVRVRIKNLNDQGGLVPVPGTSIQITEKHKSELVERIKSTGSVAIHPSGFGQGYTFSKMLRSRYDQRATAEQCKFFGMSPLFVSQFDCD